MKAPLRYFLAVALPATLGSPVACKRTDNVSSPSAIPSPSVTPAQSPPASGETIELSGLVLGVGIGMQMSEARASLDPLRAPGEHVPDVKEQAGKRVHWKLAGTEYDTIIVWANGAGTITRVRANPRAARLKPFAEIGDLSRATLNTPQQAVWTVTRPEQRSFRLIAQGDKHAANTLYMFALELAMR